MVAGARKSRLDGKPLVLAMISKKWLNSPGKHREPSQTKNWTPSKAIKIRRALALIVLIVKIFKTHIQEPIQSENWTPSKAI